MRDNKERVPARDASEKGKRCIPSSIPIGKLLGDSRFTSAILEFLGGVKENLVVFFCSLPFVLSLALPSVRPSDTSFSSVSLLSFLFSLGSLSVLQLTYLSRQSDR